MPIYLYYKIYYRDYQENKFMTNVSVVNIFKGGKTLEKNK